MKTYEEVAHKVGLEGVQRLRFLTYMRIRWPEDEVRHCIVGYATEWAERFKSGVEYFASDPTGQAVLRTMGGYK